MEKYTYYCDESVVSIARALGAELDKSNENDPNALLFDGKLWKRPTTQQMINWLLEHGISIEIHSENGKTFYYHIFDSTSKFVDESSTIYSCKYLAEKEGMKHGLFWLQAKAQCLG